MMHGDKVSFGLGIEYSLVAVSGGRSMCSAYAPRSQLDAELRMIGDVKWRVPFRMPACELVSDAAVWTRNTRRRAKQRNPLPSPTDDLMRKTDLQAG